MVALENLVQLGLHVVAQIIKAQLVVGGIGHIAGICRFFLGFWLLRVDYASRQAQCSVDFAHPFRVTLGQVVVDGDDMHALSGQCIQVSRECRNKGFTLACFHFRDVALMQKNPALQLGIKGAQSERTLGSFTAVRKSFWQKCIKTFTRHGPLGQLLGHLFDALISQRFELRL